MSQSSSESSQNSDYAPYSHALYLGLSARDNQTVSPSISCYGLDYKITTPSKIDILHHNKNPSESYPLYRYNLAAHVSATSLGTKVPIHTPTGYYKMKKITKSSDFIPLSLPHLYVRSKKPFSSEILKQLQGLTYFRSTTIRNDQTLYDIRKPSYETYRFILSLKDSEPIDLKTQAPNGVVNMEAMGTYLACLNLATLVLRTHNYVSPKQIKTSDIEISAKLTIQEYSDLKMKKRNLDSLTVSSPNIDTNKSGRVEVSINPLSLPPPPGIQTRNKRARNQESDNSGKDVDLEEKGSSTQHTQSQSSSSSAITSSSSSRAPTPTNASEGMVDTQDQVPIKLESKHITDIKLSAKPTQQTAKQLYGVIDSAPNHPGIYFPYLLELAGDDSTYVPNFIRLYLSKLLGEHTQKAGLTLNEMFQHWGMIGSTHAGKQMAHLFFCINVALECEGVCYPLTGHQGAYVYEGCIVFGYDFELMVDKTIYRPTPYLNLLKVIDEYDTHSTVLNRIYTIITGNDGDKDVSESRMNEEIDLINQIDATSMRKLSKSLLKIKLSDEQKKNIQNLAKYLHFEEPYYEVGKGQLVIECITKIQKREEYDDRAPMYHTALLSSDIVMRNLAVFGSKVPTFHIPNGRKIDISEEFKDCPKPFYYNVISIDEAVLDWHKLVQFEQIINESTSMGSKNAYFKLNDDERKQAWRVMNKVIGNEMDDEDNKKRERKVELSKIDEDDAGY